MFKWSEKLQFAKTIAWSVRFHLCNKYASKYVSPIEWIQVIFEQKFAKNNDEGVSFNPTPLDI